ncbi:MAG: hypothetical protein WAL98_17035 [Desulfatiglandaceae bacterium]|jgi:hypothetical protein
MFLFETITISIAVLYVVMFTKNHPDGGHFLLWTVLVATSAWIAEETCIRLYAFYSYSQSWHMLLSHLPLMIIVVWPVLIHSAWDLASQLLGYGHRFVPMAVGGIVLTDAAFIETVSVRSGLWVWQEPGIFNVPLIGILGWACFAFLCAFLYEEGRRRNCRLWSSLIVIVLPAVGTHLFLLVSWWGVFRWINIPIKAELAAATAWTMSIGLVFVFLRFRAGLYVKKKTLLLRLLGALFFFTLAVRNADGSVFYILFVVAFAPPYLTLMAQQYIVPHERQAARGNV